MKAHNLKHASDGPHTEKVFFLRLLDQRIFLGYNKNLAVFGQSLLQCSNGKGASNKEGRGHVREYNNIPHREHGEGYLLPGLPGFRS